MDEEEFRKRNTDCVYFLASPFTCKKGAECEYRHSERARFNPRDCWYWFNQECYNPACHFRHPPLEGRTGAEAESADSPYGVTQSVNKKNIPCYFFRNKSCKNGDRCQFYHGYDVSTHDWIPSKASSGANYVVAPEKKITTGSNSESTPVTARPSISRTTPAGAANTQHKPKKDFQQSAPDYVVSHGEDVPAGRLDSLNPAEGFIQSRSQTVNGQRPEGYLEGLMEREECLESSPEFDFNVGEKSQNLGYEDDADYSSGLGGEYRETDVDLMGYNYDEDGVKYDPECPEPGVRHEEQMHDSYGGLNTISRDSRDGSSNRIFSRKRKSMQMEPAFNRRRDVDLRDLLRKRRTTDSHGGSNCTRRNEASRLIVQRRERPQGHVQNGVYQKSRFRQDHINRQRVREKRHVRRHFLSSEPSSRSAPKERRLTEESSTFNGPKTLDQIKEEKKKAKENGDSSGVIGHSVSSRATSKSFQGPKPLDELLKDKRRLGSVVSRPDNSS